MIHHFVKDDEGHFTLPGICTYRQLQLRWDNLLQNFFMGGREIVLNLKNITRVDSAFLAFLLALLRMAQRRHVTLKIINITANIKSLMQVQGIWPLFKELIG